MTNLEKAHEIEFTLLKKIKEVFAENNIEWFLDAGTLLGAARHKGFIPWDDDVDIIMTPENYKKFLELTNDDFGNDYKIIKYDDNTNKWSEETNKFGDEDLFEKNHLNVDIFVMEKTYKSKLLHLYYMLHIAYYIGLGISHRRSINFKEKQYNVFAKIVLRLLTLLGKKLSLKQVYNKYNSFVDRLSSSNSKYCCNPHTLFSYLILKQILLLSLKNFL